MSGRPSNHLRHLRRRRDHLAERIEERRAQGATGVSYDRAEKAALDWAIPILEAENARRRAEQEVSRAPST